MGFLQRPSACGIVHLVLGAGAMKLYRVNKVAKPGGVVINKKHILASSDQQAINQAAESSDCPVCDVLRDGERVGSVL